jgi:hypothetical protein
MGILKSFEYSFTILLIDPQIAKLVFTDLIMQYIMDPNISIC